MEKDAALDIVTGRCTWLKTFFIIFIISNLFSGDLTTTFTKQCKANSCQPQI